jgi:CheY-like chemotaxis protein
MILKSPLALVGVVMQWGSCVLLLLLCYRLGRIDTHRRMLWTWMAAWAAEAASVTGFTIQAAAALAGHPIDGIRALQWFDAVYAPATLLFLVLVRLSVSQVVGRRMSIVAERGAVVAAIAAGILVTLVGRDILTGALLVIVTATIVVGSVVLIMASERRLRSRRFLLIAAIAFFGVVALTYQSIRYFGGVLDPFGDFADVVLPSSGYAHTLASAILGAAVIVLITEDGVRARQHAEEKRLRELDASAARLVVITESVGDVIVAERWRDAAEREVRDQQIAAVVVAEARTARPRPMIEGPVALRAPDMLPRTATLPRPIRHPDGRMSEALLVDDESAARSTLARIFHRGGWAIREAATGAEALNWLLGVDTRDAPAVVLCSFRMPGIGGRELYAHLQQERPEFLHRLVFVANDADNSPALEFSRAAECQLVHKPITVEEVARAVEHVTRGAMSDVGG